LIKVANIIEEGKVGGPQIRIVGMANAMAGNVETTVIMPEHNSATFQQICNDNNVKYKTLPLTRLTREKLVAVRYIIFSVFEIIRLCIYFRKEKFDIIHVSGGSWQYKGIIAGKISGIKVLWHINDTYAHPFLRKLFSKISYLSDGFVYASNRSLEYYRDVVPEYKKSFIVPAPVDTEKFKPKLYYPGYEELIIGFENKFVIGMVANINPIKGIENFLKLANFINSNSINIHFVIVGTVYENQKKYYEKLQCLCSDLDIDNISFVQNCNDVRPILNRMDVYVCSSLSESSPISVWEAISMGKPVVSTDVGDVPFYVKNGINGYVESTENIEVFAKRILSFKNDLRKLEEYGNNSRMIAIKHLDISNSSYKQIKAYYNLHVN